jgi:hypothetical protein
MWQRECLAPKTLIPPRRLHRIRGRYAALSTLVRRAYIQRRTGTGQLLFPFSKYAPVTTRFPVHKPATIKLTHYRKVWSAVLVQHSQKELRTVDGIAPTDPRSLYPPLTPGVRRAPPPGPLRGGVSFGRSAVRGIEGTQGGRERYQCGPLDRLPPQAPLSPQPFPGFTNPLTAEKAPAGFGIRTASLMPSAAAALKRRTTKIEDALFLEARYVRP